MYIHGPSYKLISECDSRQFSKMSHQSLPLKSVARRESLCQHVAEIFLVIIMFAFNVQRIL